MLMSETIKLVKLVLVMLATNATSERSFSCLRRIKTYLRTKMGQQRLNHLMVLTTNKEKTDSLDLESVAREFISKSFNSLQKIVKNILHIIALFLHLS